MTAPLQLSAAAQMRQIRALCGHAATVRAERLQIRAIERDWADEQLAALLLRLAHKHSLTRAKGWGSAGQCPASTSAKTPAAGERDGGLAACYSHLLPARASHGPAPGSSENGSAAGARVRSPEVRHG
jgi:hypothetical protein